MTPLAPDEYSRPVRVRAPSWVFVELARRCPAEVGELLQTALRGKGELASPPERVTPPRLNSPTALHGIPEVSTGPRAELSSTLLSIVHSLRGGAVAEYDHRERKWMVSDKGSTYAVYKRDLAKLVKADLIQEDNNRYRAK